MIKNLSIFLLFSSNYIFSSIPKVKVLLAKNRSELSLKGKNLKRTYRNLNRVSQFNGIHTITFDCADKGNLKNNNLSIYLQSSDQLLQWGKDMYEGNFVINSNHTKDSCDLILETSLERYVSLILTKEMNPNWPIEALKAQAIAARTYAFYKMKKMEHSPFHLENSEKNQVNGSLNDLSNNVLKATTETKNELLVSQSGKIYEVYYHAECGGKTKLPQYVWQQSVPGYTSVNCPYCHKRSKTWKKELSISNISKKLNKFLKSSGDFLGIIDNNKFNNYFKYFSSTKTMKIPKSKLRNMFGRKTLPSSNFQLDYKNGKIVASGKGRGHSVGMCQMGALDLAKKGYSYKDILSHYFPFHYIIKIK